jgi:RNA polymerase sigma factor (sigma-70 family)
MSIGSFSDFGDEVSEEQLMEAYLAGNNDALGILIKKILPRLGAIARKHFSNVEQADDALQEGLEIIIKKAKSFRGESKVFTWMHTVMSNLCIDIYRREAGKVGKNIYDEELLQILEDESADFTEKSISQIVVHEALAKLSEEHRQILTLVDLEGRSIEEVSAILDIAPGTVKSRCSRGRVELAKILINSRDKDGTKESLNSSNKRGVGGLR